MKNTLLFKTVQRAITMNLFDGPISLIHNVFFFNLKQTNDNTSARAARLTYACVSHNVYTCAVKVRLQFSAAVKLDA